MLTKSPESGTVQPPYFAEHGGHGIKTAKYQRYSLFRGVCGRAISRQQRNALEILKYFVSQPKIKRFSKFKVLPDLKNAVQLIGIVVEALSLIITAVTRENDALRLNFIILMADLGPQRNLNNQNRWRPLV